MRKIIQSEAPVDYVDTSFLKGLLGYNTRRATLMIFERFDERVAEYALTPVDFSVLCLIGRNPNIMPSQICHVLALLPPNLAKILKRFSKRDLIQRINPQSDKRAVMLSLSVDGKKLLRKVEKIVVDLEREAASQLTDKQLAVLMSSLQKVYSQKTNSIESK
jgi:DNA-binding MarR family transcriptional regulator